MSVDPDYVAQWPWLEAVKERIPVEVELDAREARLLEELKSDPDFFDFSDEEIVRFLLLPLVGGEVHERTEAAEDSRLSRWIASPEIAPGIPEDGLFLEIHNIE